MRTLLFRRSRHNYYVAIEMKQQSPREESHRAEGSIQSDPLPTIRREVHEQGEPEQTSRQTAGGADVLPTDSILDPLLDRSFDLPPRFQQRRRRPRYVTGTSTTDDFQSDEQNRIPEEHPSFAQNALNGTFGLLRQVGGVTLSTTGALVAPPLHVTRRVLLPQLWAIFVDVWESNAPQRLKDWFQIFQSSIYHIIHTLRNTSAGHTVRRRWLIVWQDLLDILSTDLTRQALIDTVGTLVKASEALNTDEANACFDQIAVAMTRILEVLSNPRCRLLIHDWRQAIASVATILADPVATTALAEVTAYLCYALEREQTQQDNQRRRHRYQTSMNQRDTVHKHPTMTVEEAILSSLDPTPMTSDTADESTNDVNLPWDTASSIRNQVEEDAADSSMDWKDKARRDVDVQYLREMIEERAMEQQSQRAMEDIAMERSKEANASRERVHVETVSEEDSREDNVVTFTSANKESTSQEQKVGPLRLDGEAPIDQFERILNDILVERRSGGVPLSRHSTVNKKVTPTRSPLKKPKPKQSGGRLLVFIGIGLVLGIGTLWFGFGCFGVYLYRIHYHHTRQLSTNQHEIVVRVVKEIVHVDAKGKTLGHGIPGLSSNDATGEEIEKVAACVADAYKN